LALSLRATLQEWFESNPPAALSAHKKINNPKKAKTKKGRHAAKFLSQNGNDLVEEYESDEIHGGHDSDSSVNSDQFDDDTDLLIS
jgi:hypothetical protein